MTNQKVFRKAKQKKSQRVFLSAIYIYILHYIQTRNVSKRHQLTELFSKGKNFQFRLKQRNTNSAEETYLKQWKKKNKLPYAVKQKKKNTK